MTFWRRLKQRISGRIDSEIDCELRDHIDLEAEEQRNNGLNATDARHAAMRALGNEALVKEDTRAMWGWTMIERLLQDARYAVRTLRKAPVFTGVVIGTLALGIGGVTAVYSVVQAVLLAPLPYESPGQLVRLYQQVPNDPSSAHYMTGAYFREIRDHVSSFDEVVALGNYNERGLDLVSDQQAQRLRVLRVTSGYFEVLRTGSLRGPGFTPEDETGTRRIVLSDRLWRSRFHADPSMIGQTIQLSSEPYEIAGVAPAGFEDPVAGEIDGWTPYNLAADTDVEDNSLSLIGRLRNGVSLDQGSAELASLSKALAERWPKVARSAIAVQPLKEDLVRKSRGTLNMLSIAVALVLLVACLNVANLFLVRTTSRAREFAIRSTLGSGGFRIARQLLVESVLLAIAGGVAGLALAELTIRSLRILGNNAIPRLDDVGLDPLVLGVTAAVTLFTGFAFGLAPAIRFARVQPGAALQLQSRSAMGDRGHLQFRNSLAMLQVALALTLLTGAGILTASFYKLRQVDLGFRVDGVLTFNLSLPRARYDAAQRAIFQEEVARRIGTIPGVTSAGGVSRLPATGSYHPWGSRIMSGPHGGSDFSVRSQNRVVSGSYFAALGISVLAGRVFDARDDVNAPGRAVVSAQFVRQAFPGLNFDEALGRQFTFLGYDRREIIGVVGDVTLDTYSTATPYVYHAHRQLADNRTWALTQVVATRLPPEQTLTAIRTEVAAMDPQLVVYQAAPMGDIVGRGISRERFALALMGAFATVALLLAAIGLYGVIAYSVRQRTQEFGIRMAVGATSGEVRNLVLRQAATVVGAGVVMGVCGAVAMGKWLSSLTYQTSPYDPSVFGATALLLIGVALLSAWLPARRASRVDPMTALRSE